VIGAFFLAAIAMLVAGVAAAVVDAIDPWPWGRWLALHLIFVGGISQLVLGASQFFAGAFLATDPPGRGWIRAQLVAWNAGAVLLAIAVPVRSDALVDFAVAALLIGLACYGWSLLSMQRGSLQRAPWAVRWYLAAAFCLALGITAGTMLATGAAWPHGNLLSAHMALNVGGWFGAAIVGTLHTFFPSLTRSTLARPRLQAPTFAAWIAGIAALAVGYGWLIDPLAVAGWIALTIAAAALSVNIALAPRPVTLPARMLALAQAFLVAGLLVACVGAISNGPADALAGSFRPAVGTLLVAGWVGVTVLGSLFHLLSVLVRVRDLRTPLPAPRPRLDAATAVVVALGVLGVAATRLAEGTGLDGLASAVLLVAYAMLAMRLVRLIARVLTVARPIV
jgi:nitrite reductase (NO-forming)